MAKARRSRLRVGVDVPWVTSWSCEPVLGVGPCGTVEGRLAIRQAERPGYGRPQYSMNHLRRQRASVAAMLCPMCGEPTRAGERWTQIARPVTAAALRARGPTALPSDVTGERVVIDAGAIAPSHLDCLRRSLAECPHLRADPNVQVLAFPRRWVAWPLLVAASAPTPAPHVLARPPAPASVPVVSFLQLCGIPDA